MVIGKKGEKELQMIFGLFILLIITLVVLNLFLQTAKQGGSKVAQVQEQELKAQELQRLKLSCEALCQQIVDENTAIEFCAKFESLDRDENKKKNAEKKRYGKYEFCSTKVPCFLVIENCQSIYTGAGCKALLLQNPATWDLYNKLVKNVNSNGVTPDDGCGLSMIAPSNNSNWKLWFGYEALPP